MITYLKGCFAMFIRLQLVVLGLAISQGITLSAMENKATNSPHSPRRLLSCSQESRLQDSGDVPTVAALKRSLEIRKEEKVNMYYPWPGATPEIYSKENIQDSMKPWYSHFY